MPASERLEPLKTIFFLGAGASRDAGLPTITELTDGFLDNPNKHGGWVDTTIKHEEKIRRALKILVEVTDDYFHGKMDLELMMSLILRLQNKKEKEIFDAKYEQLQKISDEMLWSIRNLIQSFIRNECENIKSTDYFWPLEGMSQKEKDILAKFEEGIPTTKDIDEQKRLRNITKAKLRKKK